jgi:hypothetical protein
MTYIRNIFLNLFKLKKYSDNKPILGRWNITKSEKHLNKKIYLANHDNCGPCGLIQDYNNINY